MAQSSNIRVFPTFPDAAFFSGEEFSCTLTFKNVAESSPLSSSTSLVSPDLQKGSALGTLFGGPWLSDAGRSASEGVPADPVRPKGLRHMRSRSTVGSNPSESVRTTSLQRNHSRTQSLAVSPSSTEPTTPVPPKPQKEEPEGMQDVIQRLIRSCQWFAKSEDRHEWKIA
jgi:hypothetical protein